MSELKSTHESSINRAKAYAEYAIACGLAPAIIEFCDAADFDEAVEGGSDGVGDIEDNNR